MEKPFPAYSGDEEFVFVCYAHSDADAVYSDITHLNQHEINIWYDEGIPAGHSWRGEIANAIKGAKKFLLFLSDNSLNSSHCLREIDFAINNDVDIIPVYLDDKVELPDELALVLNRVQALKRNSDSRYFDHLVSALTSDKSHYLPAQSTAKKPFSVIAGLCVIVVIGMGFYWFIQEGREEAPSPQVSSQQENVYDLYLEAQDLMERWNQDSNLNSAISLFRQAIDLDSQFALAYARLSNALRIQYVLSNNSDFLIEAGTVVNQGMSINSELAPMQIAAGRVQLTQGNYDLAIIAFERAIELDANDPDAHQALARTLELMGRIDEADSTYQLAISLDPERVTAIDGYANFLFRQARYEEAIDNWRTVVRLAPDPFALLNLGSALNEAGMISEAITMYERANEITPTYMAYSNLGTSLSVQRQFDRAVEAYEQALELENENWLAWGNLAFVLSWTGGEEGRALETFERAIELAELERGNNPRDPYVNIDLALYYAKTGNSALAEQRVESALALAQDSSDISAYAAEVYEILEQYDEVIPLLASALASGYPIVKLRQNYELRNVFEDEAREQVLALAASEER